MPKIVDHEERRAELAAAVRRVAARAGIEGATVRAVAAEAGWSPGALRYYFTTQGELIDFAVTSMLTDVSARLREIECNNPSSPERAIAMLELLLPLDDVRLAEVRLYVAFASRASIHRDDALLAQLWDGTRYVCARALADASGLEGPTELRAVPTHLRDATHQLQVHVDGLSVLGSGMPDRMPPAQIRASVRARLLELVAGLHGTDRTGEHQVAKLPHL